MPIELPRILSHAYLISGGSHTSRMDAALEFTRGYLCEHGIPPCGKCRACHKVTAGIHPDVTVLGPDDGKATISVDQARTMRSNAYIRPNEGRHKVYIIDPADALLPESQGALLQILEEGPAYAAFLLLTSEASLMLETIRSRCEPIVLPPDHEDTDPELLAKADNLATLLIQGDEFAVMKGFVALEQEKISTQELSDLLLLTEDFVSDHLPDTHPQKYLQAGRVLDALRTAREDAIYNLNPGLTLGRMAAQIFR